MSWSFSGVGKPAGLIEKMHADLKFKISEPEETIKNEVMATIERALSAFPSSFAVEVIASGSQSSVGSDNTSFANSLQVSIKPLWGFVE